MTDTTPNLALPLLHPAQAQKEWTVNEALTLLDALAGGAALHCPATAPPFDSRPGGLWRVGAGATGEWAGRDGQLAVASVNGWRFVPPREGSMFPRASDGAPVRFADGAWREGALALDELVLAGYNVGGGPAIAEPTGGSVVDAPARTALTQLLSALRAQGLIGG